MSSEEYVNQVNRLMDLQTTYLNIFLGILGIATGIFLVFQWRYSDKQIEKVIEKTKNETIEEIEKILGINNLGDFRDSLDNKFASKDKENLEYAQNQFEFCVQIILHDGKSQLWRLPNALKAYKTYLTRDIQFFDYTMSRLNLSLTSAKNKIDFNDPYFGLMIDTLMRYEAEMHQQSVELIHLRNQLNSLRMKQNNVKA